MNQPNFRSSNARGGIGRGWSGGMLKFRTDRLITVRGDVKVKQSADSILNLELFST